MAATFYWLKRLRALSSPVYVDPILGATANAGTINAPKKYTSNGGTFALSDGDHDCTGIALLNSYLYGSGKTKLINVNTASNINKLAYLIMKNATTARLTNVDYCTLDTVTNTDYGYITNSFIKNMTLVPNGTGALLKGCTIVSSIVRINQNYAFAGSGVNNCLLYNSQISLEVAMTSSIYSILNNLFHTNCTWQINGSGYQSLSYWETQTGLSGMAAIRSAYLTAFPTGILSAAVNQITDPLFIDPTNNIFQISPNSPAIGYGISGVNCGSFGIGKKVNILQNSIGTPNSIDLATASNVTITDNLVTVNHNDQNVIPGNGVAEIISTQSFGNPSEIGKIDLGFTDYQSTGEVVDANLQIDSTSISAGTALEDGKEYQVFGANITYGSTYTPGQRFLASGTGSFTGSGTVKKILEYPNYKTIALRWKLSVPLVLISAGTALTENCWYEVVNNSIIYNGNSRVAGEIIHVETGITSFTGSGQLKKIFDVSDSWYYFLPTEYPYFKRVGDTINGAIDLTNGQQSYHDSSNDSRPDFSVICKYLQIKINVQSVSPY